MTTPDDFLVGIANTYIAIWNTRLEMIESGKMTTAEFIDGVKVDTTQKTVAELHELIKFQQDFIKTRGMVRVR